MSLPLLPLVALFVWGPVAPQWVSISDVGVVEKHFGMPFDLDVPGAGGSVDRVWFWSGEVAPRRLERAEIEDSDNFRYEPADTSVRVRLGDQRELTGQVIAAPASMWTEVPEDFLPRWPVETGAVLILPGDPSEAWRFRFVSEGHGTWWVDSRPGQSEVTLDPTAADSLPFAVTSSDGGPLAGATLNLAESSPARGAQRFLVHYRTDLEGVAAVPALPDLADVSVYASAQDHIPRVLSGRPGVLPEIIELERGVSVHGRFLDVERRPVAGVKVQLETTVGAIFWSTVATSGSDGRFEIPGVEPGDGVCRASAEGFGTRRAEIEIGPDGLDLGDLILEPEALLDVRVVDPGGEPIPGASVTTLAGPSATADADGIARLRGLSAAERLDLDVDAEGFKRSETSARPPLPATLDVVLEPVFTLTGRFVDARGLALAQGRASVRYGSRTTSRRLETDGGFTLEVEPDLEVELSLRSPESAALTLALEPGRAGEIRDLGTLTAPVSRSLTGRLVSGLDGRPVAGARLAVARGGRGHAVTSWFWGDLLTAVSDAEGRFELRGLEPVSSEVRIDAAGFARRTVPFEPPPVAESTDLGEIDLGEIDLGEIVLEAGVDVEVRLEGASTERAVARLDLVGRWLEVDMLTAPFAEGYAFFRNVPAGPVLLTVMRGRELLCEREVEIPDGRDLFETSCEAGGLRVSGLVRLGGQPASAGTLLWLPPALDSPSIIERTRSALGQTQAQVFGGGRPQVDVTVDAGGYFSTDRLTPGRWSVVWHPDSGGGSATREVVLPDRESVELEIDFPLGSVAGRVLTPDGEAVADARVREQRTGQTVFSAEDGSYRLVGLEPGTRWLRAEAGSRRSATEEVQIEGGEPAQLDLVLGGEDPRESLVLEVIGENGPTAGAFVFIETLPASGQRVLTAGPAGEVEVEWSPPFPERFRVAAWAADGWAFGSWQPLPEDPAAGWTIRIPDGGSLVVDGLDSARGLKLLSPEGWDVAQLLRRLGRLPRPGPGAPWTVSGLPAGAYTLDVGTGSPQQLFVRADAETRHAVE